jgi:hypothetical protein
VLELNNYTSNYGSANKGIISITGLNIPIIRSEYLSKNGDTFDEKVTEYSGGIKAVNGTFTYYNLITSTARYYKTMKVIYLILILTLYHRLKYI